MNTLDHKNDDLIREALRNSDLNVVAAVVGIAGGAEALTEIMNSTGELSPLDRGMLSMHLLN